jgi:hypothetical protein
MIYLYYSFWERAVGLLADFITSLLSTFFSSSFRSKDLSLIFSSVYCSRRGCCLNWVKCFTYFILWLPYKKSSSEVSSVSFLSLKVLSFCNLR